MKLRALKIKSQGSNVFGNNIYKEIKIISTIQDYFRCMIGSTDEALSCSRSRSDGVML